MQKKAFSYAEAMVTMLIVAIIMVATTPIITKKMAASKNSSIWSWASDSVSTYFGTAENQRVSIGGDIASDANESARLIVYEATDRSENNTILPPIMLFKKTEGNVTKEIGRLAVNQSSVALGYQALQSITAATPQNSTAIGAGALKGVTIGQNNTAIGFNACQNITDGSNNICIGNASGPADNASNTLEIGEFIKGDDTSVTINKNLLLNTSINLNGSPYNNVAEAITKLGTDLYAFLIANSDIRLKNVLGNSYAGLNEINKIQVKKYTFKKDKKKVLHVGVIAQELRNVFPNSVSKGDDGYLRITKDEMFYAMLNAIKELSQKFNNQDEKVSKMQEEIEMLKKENATLTQKISEIEASLQQAK